MSWYSTPFYDDPWHELNAPQPEPSLADEDERCARGHHTPVVVDVLGIWNPVLVYQCSWCKETLYEIPQVETVESDAL